MLKLYKLVKKSWWQLLIIVLLVAGQTLLQLTLPDYISKIQEIITTAGPGSLSSETIGNLFKQGGLMLLISAGIFLLAAGQGLLNSYFVATFGATVRKELFSKVEGYSLSNVSRFGTASLLTRLTNDARSIQNFMFMINRVFVMSPIFLIIGSTKLFRLNPNYFYIVLITLPLVLIIMLLTFKFASPLFVEIQKRLDYVTLLFREGLTGVRVIRALTKKKENGGSLMKQTKT